MLPLEPKESLESIELDVVPNSEVTIQCPTYGPKGTIIWVGKTVKITDSPVYICLSPQGNSNMSTVIHTDNHAVIPNAATRITIANEEEATPYLPPGQTEESYFDLSDWVNIFQTQPIQTPATEPSAEEIYELSVLCGCNYLELAKTLISDGYIIATKIVKSELLAAKNDLKDLFNFNKQPKIFNVNSNTANLEFKGTRTLLTERRQEVNSLIASLQSIVRRMPDKFIDNSNTLISRYLNNLINATEILLYKSNTLLPRTSLDIRAGNTNAKIWLAKKFEPIDNLQLQDCNRLNYLFNAAGIIRSFITNRSLNKAEEDDIKIADQEKIKLLFNDLKTVYYITFLLHFKDKQITTNEIDNEIKFLQGRHRQAHQNETNLQEVLLLNIDCYARIRALEDLKDYQIGQDRRQPENVLFEKTLSDTMQDQWGHHFNKIKTMHNNSLV